MVSCTVVESASDRTLSFEVHSSFEGRGDLGPRGAAIDREVTGPRTSAGTAPLVFHFYECDGFTL